MLINRIDQAAIAFNRGFYRALVNGASLEGAVVEGRLAIREAVGDSAVDWLAPLLFMRVEDGTLFEHVPELTTDDFEGAGVDSSFQVPRHELVELVARQKQKAQIRDALLESKSRICLLCGMAGVGKSALAVYMAHELRSHFPDGVLWARLPERDAKKPLSLPDRLMPICPAAPQPVRSEIASCRSASIAADRSPQPRPFPLPS